MPRRLISASELGSFAFCRRAWYLERVGQATTLAPERAAGMADHVAHQAAVADNETTARASRALIVAGLAAVVAAAAWWAIR